jgi:hypothetical protein
MKLKFINPDELDNNVKATIHKTGKLGFTAKAAKRFNLKQGMSVSIGINEDNKNDKNLYIVFNKEPKSDSFRISKAGGYFYAQTKGLFQHLCVDYSR